MSCASDATGVSHRAQVTGRAPVTGRLAISRAAHSRDPVALLSAHQDRSGAPPSAFVIGRSWRPRGLAQCPVPRREPTHLGPLQFTTSNASAPWSHAGPTPATAPGTRCGEVLVAPQHNRQLPSRSASRFVVRSKPRESPGLLPSQKIRTHLRSSPDRPRRRLLAPV